MYREVNRKSQKLSLLSKKKKKMAENLPRVSIHFYPLSASHNNCRLLCHLLVILKVIFANSVYPDQTRSSLIRVHIVCLFAKNRLETFARIFSRRHKQTTFSDAGFLGILRVKANTVKRIRAANYWSACVSAQSQEDILRKHTYSNILKISPPKLMFSDKNSDLFHISAQNIDCGNSLEPSQRGGSNEYPQSMFLSRNKTNNVYPCKPQSRDSVGTHVTKWRSLLLFLAPHKVGFFRISLFIPNGICPNKAQTTRKIKFFLVA